MQFTYEHFTVDRVIDGDTIVVTIDLGFNIKLCNRSVRIINIDAPEVRTRWALEKQAGFVVTDIVKQLLDTNELVLESHSVDKFGRILGDIRFKNLNTTLSQYLLTNNYALEYNGGAKLTWKAKVLQCIVDKHI